MHVFTAKTFTATLLEGEAHTDGPQDHDGKPWQHEIHFKVTRPAATGAKRKQDPHDPATFAAGPDRSAGGLVGQVP